MTRPIIPLSPRNLSQTSSPASTQPTSPVMPHTEADSSAFRTARPKNEIQKSEWGKHLILDPEGSAYSHDELVRIGAKNPSSPFSRAWSRFKLFAGIGGLAERVKESKKVLKNLDAGFESYEPTKMVFKSKDLAAARSKIEKLIKENPEGETTAGWRQVLAEAAAKATRVVPTREQLLSAEKEAEQERALLRERYETSVPEKASGTSMWIQTNTKGKQWRPSVLEQEPAHTPASSPHSDRVKPLTDEDRAWIRKWNTQSEETRKRGFQQRLIQDMKPGLLAERLEEADEEWRSEMIGMMTPKQIGEQMGKLIFTDDDRQKEVFKALQNVSTKSKEDPIFSRPSIPLFETNHEKAQRKQEEFLRGAIDPNYKQSTSLFEHRDAATAATANKTAAQRTVAPSIKAPSRGEAAMDALFGPREKTAVAAAPVAPPPPRAASKTSS